MKGKHGVPRSTVWHMPQPMKYVADITALLILFGTVHFLLGR